VSLNNDDFGPAKFGSIFLLRQHGVFAPLKNGVFAPTIKNGG